ncbi:MAG TPA: hypothetical protein VJS44_04585, partial [Pyrinomonadaceae bacterium]|nr:hypothetical protein [Pyrinomonadaceae bacterium]
MLNIETLDKVIAMVVVLLALSLFVQALQGWMKKLFKIKSLQIENSLVHLYHYVLNKNVMENLTSVTDNSPFLRMILPRTTHPSERDPQVKALYDGVMREFKKVGRLTAGGKLMLDSISQGDLLKFMGRMPVAGIIAKLFPDSATKFDEMRIQISSFLTAYQQIKAASQEVVTGAEFQKIEELLTPLLTDIDKFLSGASDDSGVILDDIVKLREIKAEEVRQLVNDLPDKIAAIKAQVEAGGGSDKTKGAVLTALTTMETAMEKLSDGIESIIAGFSHIRDLKTSIANWYDTVMQSFEERYARSMRTWTIILSACVVIVMNANIVNIYRDISTSSAKRAVFLQQADTLLNRSRAAAAAAAAASGAAPAPSPSPGQAPAQGAAGAQNNNVEVEKFLNEGKDVIETNANYLTAIGLKGPTWFGNIRPVMANLRADPMWVLGVIFRTLLGWLIMTMLLSVGAPFWQDVLESLFGLKNKLRQQTGTENV